MKTYCVLFNPKSDNGMGKKSAEQLDEILKDGQVEYHDVTAIPPYETFFKETLGDNPLVICGGDGTLNRFINDTANVRINNDVYYFATGSGNDFLKDIGGEKGQVVKINDYIKNLPTVYVDGKEYKFLNNVGFGIDGYCCEVGDKLRETTDKPINYAGIAVKGLLFKYKPTNAKITVDGKTYEFKKVWLAPTMHGRFYGGGMMPTPEQKRNDPEGTLSVMVMHGGKFSTLLAFPKIFKGEHVNKKKLVSIFTGKEITAEFDRPVAVQVDGETILGMTTYTAKAATVAEEKQEVVA